MTSFEKVESDTDISINILNEKFSAFQLSSLSLFLLEKLNHPLLESGETSLHKTREEVHYKRLFKKGGIAVLTLILCSLIIGHFIKKSKMQTFSEKQSEIAFLQQNQNTIDRLTEEKKE